MKKTLLLFFAAFCLQQTNAQVTPTPFDLSTQNGIPVYINAISHDTAWGGVVGMNSGTWVNLKTYGRTVDAGTTWNTDTIPDAIDRGIVDFFALDGNKAWAVMGDFNGVNPVALWKTINAGATWTLTTELDSVLAAGFFLNSIYFFSADSGIAMGDPRNGYAEVYNTSDGGTSWTRVPQVNMPASVAGEGGVIHGYAAEGDKIWFNTNKGKIYYSYDRGYTWSVSVVSSVNYYFGMAFNDSIHGVAFRDQNSSLSNEIFVTSNGGVTWTQQALSPPIILLNPPEKPNSIWLRGLAG